MAHTCISSLRGEAEAGGSLQDLDQPELYISKQNRNEKTNERQLGQGMVKVCQAATSCSEGPPPLMPPETQVSEAKLETAPSSLGNSLPHISVPNARFPRQRKDFLVEFQDLGHVTRGWVAAGGHVMMIAEAVQHLNFYQINCILFCQLT